MHLEQNISELLVITIKLFRPPTYFDPTNVPPIVSVGCYIGASCAIYSFATLGLRASSTIKSPTSYGAAKEIKAKSVKFRKS